MQGQVIDTDLIGSNISNNVEIFGVTGSYVNTTLDAGIYALGGPAITRDLGSGGGNLYRGALRFYDDGTKIIIMGSSEIEAIGSGFSQNGLAGYYAEINKSTGVLTKYTALIVEIGTTTSWGNTKLVYTNIGGSNRYGFTRASSTSSSGFFYFNGISIVQGGGTEILAAGNIGATSMSYRGRTLTEGPRYTMGESVFYGTGGVCLQTLQYS